MSHLIQKQHIYINILTDCKYKAQNNKFTWDNLKNISSFETGIIFPYFIWGMHNSFHSRLKFPTSLLKKS